MIHCGGAIYLIDLSYVKAKGNMTTSTLLLNEQWIKTFYIDHFT